MCPPGGLCLQRLQATTLCALQEAKLLKMHEMVLAMGPGVGPGMEPGVGPDPPEWRGSPGAVTAGAEAGVNSYNLRVPLDGDDEEDEDEEEDDEGDSDDGVEPAIPDRQQMKKMHGMMLDKANAKGKKKKKKGNAESPTHEGAESASKPLPALPGSRSAGRRDLE